VPTKFRLGGFDTGVPSSGKIEKRRAALIWISEMGISKHAIPWDKSMKPSLNMMATYSTPETCQTRKSPSKEKAARRRLQFKPQGSRITRPSTIDDMP
jgi:hypothetical protein